MKFIRASVTAIIFALLTTAGAKTGLLSQDVPITLQTVFVMLSGLAGGAWIGFASQVIYLLLGLFFPVFAGSGSGVDVFHGPTAGFLFSFPLAAFLTGIIAQTSVSLNRIMAAVLLAQTLVFLSGVLGMWYFTDWGWNASVRYAFIDLALTGYAKALFTGLSWYGYLMYRLKKVKTF